MPKRARVTRCSCSRCEAKSRVRSPIRCCAVRIPWSVCSNVSWQQDWMLCLGTRPGAERERSRLRGRAELLRVIELDPHEVGQDMANWTTERLAQYLGQHTGIQVTQETVRLYLHAHDYVCKRPTWTDASAKPSRRPITWETPAGRGSVSRYHNTRTSTCA